MTILELQQAALADRPGAGAEDYCTDCNGPLDPDGWNGRCGSCADHAEALAEQAAQPSHPHETAP